MSVVELARGGRVVALSLGTVRCKYSAKKLVFFISGP